MNETGQRRRLRGRGRRGRGTLWFDRVYNWSPGGGRCVADGRHSLRVERLPEWVRCGCSPSEPIPQHDALNRGAFGCDRFDRGRRSISTGPERGFAAVSTAAVIRLVLLMVLTRRASAAAAAAQIFRLGSEPVPRDRRRNPLGCRRRRGLLPLLCRRRRAQEGPRGLRVLTGERAGAVRDVLPVTSPRFRRRRTLWPFCGWLIPTGQTGPERTAAERALPLALPETVATPTAADAAGRTSSKVGAVDVARSTSAAATAVGKVPGRAEPIAVVVVPQRSTRVLEARVGLRGH